MRKRGLMNHAPLGALAGMALLSQASLAQQLQPELSAASAPAPIPYSPAAGAAAQEGAAQAGGLTLKLAGTLVTVHPSVNVDVRRDDNIFFTPNNRTADQILVLTPALRLEARQANNSFALRMSTTIGQFQHSTADNYTNYNVNGLADLDLGTRLRASLSADYLDGDDPRGSTNNPLSSTPDRYRQIQGRGIFRYGSPGAKGRIDFELGRLQRDYYNNRTVTAAEDRVVDDIAATFNWLVGPRTTFLLQGKHTRIDYTLSGSTLGSVENAVLAGAIWEASAVTKATFKIGTVQKVFDDPARDRSNSITWLGDVVWSPRTYSHVDLNFSRAPVETTGGVGNFIDRTTNGARWTHDWSSRFTTEAAASYMTDVYEGAARTDKTQNYEIKATHKMRRWLSWGGDYAHGTRISNDNTWDYRRNVFMLFLNAAL